MTSKTKLRMMQASEIPAFVEAVIETGCDICACGDDLYTIGDADLSDEEFKIAAPQLRAINRKFGDRDFLRREIVGVSGISCTGVRLNIRVYALAA